MAGVSYRLYWAEQPGVSPGPAARSLAAASPPLLHGGLVNGSPYYYVLTAVNSAGQSPPSPEATATPADGTAGDDALFPDQWHLDNRNVPGEDVNVLQVWQACAPGEPTCRGEGVRVALVDDGLEVRHADLQANVATGESHDYVEGDADPTGGLHGTLVAGALAARDANGQGLRGTAPRSSLVAFNAVATARLSDLADAMVRDERAAVSSNSWGALDGSGIPSPAPAAWQAAVEHGIAEGRSRRGVIYVWAAGNGHGIDNSNYDGYANHRAVLAVGAVDVQGRRAAYSERGANLWISAPGGDGGSCGTGSIATTDRTGSEGVNPDPALPDYADLAYTRCVSGTSLAAPLVSGVAALMLQANPALTWRDLRLILAETARRNHPDHPDWTVNGAGYGVNHDYGFGVVDAAAAVARARTWSDHREGLPTTFESALAEPALAIPDNDPAGVQDSITVSGSGIGALEWVQVEFSAEHSYLGDLEVVLTSPAGTVSRLAETHACNCTGVAYRAWIFGSARHLGEAADGTWTIGVRDGAQYDTGVLSAWRLRLFGR